MRLKLRKHSGILSKNRVNIRYAINAIKTHEGKITTARDHDATLGSFFARNTSRKFVERYGQERTENRAISYMARKTREIYRIKYTYSPSALQLQLVR